MANYLTAVAITLDPAHEGGYQANPKDRANWSSGVVGVGELIGTKYGITALDLPGTIIKNLTEDQAITWYSTRYWKPGYSSLVSQDVANKLFDMGVLFGIATATMLLQRALDVAPDGVFGPGTLTAANKANAVLLLSEFKNELHAHASAIAAANPNDAPDLPDWSRRIDS